MTRWAIEPFHKIKSRRFVQLHRIPMEQIRDDDEVAIGGKLISDKLNVDELVANDVC